MSKHYGDGGFFFVQPINSPRQVVSTYGDGGFFFVQPINSPQQVVSTYGALIHPKSGLQYGAPQIPQRRTGRGGNNGAPLGKKMTIADANGVIKTYPCPIPGVVYDPNIDPCGEKPWWSSNTAWNTYRLTGKWPAAEGKEDPKCAEMVQAYLAARNMPGVSESALSAMYENLTKMGCSISLPRPEEERTPGQDTPQDIEKEEASLETEEEESFLSRYGLALGIGAGVLLLGGATALIVRRRRK